MSLIGGLISLIDGRICLIISLISLISGLVSIIGGLISLINGLISLIRGIISGLISLIGGLISLIYDLISLIGGLNSLTGGIKGYNKILEDERSGHKPIYRSKEWRKSARRMDKKRKKSSWLGSYKSCIFVPPTPGSELKTKLQSIEKDMRPGGRENWPIRIIETSGKTLESVLVKADPFQGNNCLDPKCLPNKNVKNKISCRRNNIGYRIPCKLCPASYLGESGENMHTRAKSHLSKFYSKTKHIRESSAFYKHISNKHGGVQDGSTFEDYFDIFIVKAYRKPITRIIEEGVFIINHEGEILNSKTEWHQPKIICTTILQGGAEMAGGMITRFPVDGRRAESLDVQHVVNDKTQEDPQETIGRTTRAMARRAGGL